MARTKAVQENEAIKLPTPGVSWDWLIKLLLTLLTPITTIMSQGLREELITFLKARYKEAQETPNPWDNVIFALFLRFLGVDPDATE